MNKKEYNLIDNQVMVKKPLLDDFLHDIWSTIFELAALLKHNHNSKIKGCIIEMVKEFKEMFSLKNFDYALKFKNRFDSQEFLYDFDYKTIRDLLKGENND